MVDLLVRTQAGGWLSEADFLLTGAVRCPVLALMRCRAQRRNIRTEGIVASAHRMERPGDKRARLAEDCRKQAVPIMSGTSQLWHQSDHMGHL